MDWKTTVYWTSAA